MAAFFNRSSMMSSTAAPEGGSATHPNLAADEDQQRWRTAVLMIAKIDFKITSVPWYPLFNSLTGRAVTLTVYVGPTRQRRLRTMLSNSSDDTRKVLSAMLCSPAWSCGVGTPQAEYQSAPSAPCQTRLARPTGRCDNKQFPGWSWVIQAGYWYTAK
jgi:hypothetical protein